MVASPLPSTRVTVRRVAPATGWSASSTVGAEAASSARSSSPTAPPTRPVATTRCPSAAAIRATLRPLPPARAVTAAARLVVCSRSGPSPASR
ncbi:hypothetical protein BIV57_13005 [Mangrovactinospora gilvigrisea]|uniref:Uncharacterized protein n=1 Tax=Mangrovactinospora gilvigrisea TaxID=1428644 RepID=A0A1J7BES9_9ACTN|nr:hypothetical protein BIV57_13005 [Mangrovactinospora gilvigrisea]